MFERFERHQVRTRADAFSDGLMHRKPTAASRLLLFWFNFTERIAPWYRWPRFTVVPFIYLMIRRRTLAQNLVEVSALFLPNTWALQTSLASL